MVRAFLSCSVEPYHAFATAYNVPVYYKLQRVLYLRQAQAADAFLLSHSGDMKVLTGGLENPRVSQAQI